MRSVAHTLKKPLLGTVGALLLSGAPSAYTTAYAQDLRSSEQNTIIQSKLDQPQVKKLTEAERVQKRALMADQKSMDSFDRVAKSLQSLLKEAEMQGLVKTHKQGSNDHGALSFDIQAKDQSKTVEGYKAGSSETVKSVKSKKNSASMRFTLAEKCEAFEVLDYSEFHAAQTYGGLQSIIAGLGKIQTAAQSHTVAQHYIALGLGAEARAALSERKDATSVLLKELSKIIDGETIAYQASFFKDYERCDLTDELWLALSSPTFFEHEHTPADRAQIMKSLRALPAKMEDILGLRLGIKAAQNGDTLLGKRLAQSLERNFQSDKMALNDVPRSDDAYIYLLALLGRKKEPEKAKARLEHLARKDGEYQFKALSELNALSVQDAVESDHQQFSELESELKYLQQKHQDTNLGRQAAIQLIELYTKESNLEDAYELAKKSVRAEHKDYELVVNTIADALMVELDSESRRKRLSGLNLYVKDIPFYDVARTAYALKEKTLEVALGLGLGGLFAGKDQKGEQAANAQTSNGQSLAELTVKIEKGGSAFIAADLEKVKVDTVQGQAIYARAIEKKLQDGRLNEAKRLIGKLPAGDKKSSYEADLAWLENDWDEVSQVANQSDATSVNDNDAAVYTGQKAALATMLSEPGQARPRGSSLAKYLHYIDEVEGSVSLAKEYLKDG